MLRVGLISDTHGLLRPEAKAFLQGSDYIVHGGDICDPKISFALLAAASYVFGRFVSVEVGAALFVAAFLVPLVLSIYLEAAA